MGFSYLLLIAVINSIDNMGIRIAYSMGGIKVQIVKNLLISLMAFAVSFTAALTGGIISGFFSEEVCSIASMAILVFMGIKIALEPYLKKKADNPIKAISYREAISIGTALALDDFGGSVSVGLVGCNPFSVGLAFFIVSFLIFVSGNYFIIFFAKLKIGNIATIIAGASMIIIGISQVL